MWRPWAAIEEHEGDRAPVENLVEFEDSIREQNITSLRTHLSLQSQQVVLNVYNNLTTENFGYKKKIIERTAKLTGVSYGTVYKLAAEGIFHRKTRIDKGKSKVDMYGFDRIRRKIFDFYRRNEVPNLCKLLSENGEIHCGVSTLSRILRQNGFKFKTIDKRRRIMESPRIQRLRDEYLTQLKTFRDENRFICYLDETWYDSHDSVKKGWLDDSEMCQIDVPVSNVPFLHTQDQKIVRLVNH
ncbi:secreted modular calcium-binding protein [Holotrichia oblita]|uniref:Secreted modular calcium-binding protein n=1 Tax=Holotrichia oblita TaxID=644536 RepID=A0ACB9SJ81_HOLOL|nr:secreted modular calcium-binding protein [Holotrichia oblita]